MAIKSFNNEGLFPVNSIDGFNVSTTSFTITDPDQRKSSLLFDGNKSLETGAISAASVIWPASYFPDNIVRQYVIFVDPGYVGKEFAIIDKNRLSARFTLEFTVLSSGFVDHQTITSIDNNSVGPEIRRLYALGYI